jgi:Fe-S-cluster containining protein
MDLQDFRRKAIRNKKGLVTFLKKFDQLVPPELQEIVAEEDAKVWAQVDCTTCANCCKTMTPTYSKTDIRRISKHLRMSAKDFVEKWLYQDEDSGDWMNKNLPCQFLQPDNRCGIYEVRPLDCAEFPHHNKKPFDEYNETFVGNVSRCPATYELISQMKKRIENEYEF